MPRNPLPEIHVYHHIVKLFFWLLFLGILFGVALFLWLYGGRDGVLEAGRYRGTPKALAAWAMVIFMLILIPLIYITTKKFFTFAPILTLSVKGLYLHGQPTKNTFFDWDEIKYLEKTVGAGGACVAIYLRKPEPHKNLGNWFQKRRARQNQRLFKTPILIPISVLKIKPDYLLKILDQYWLNSFDFEKNRKKPSK